MISNQTNNIYPKSCVYNCGIQIYWNTATSEYWEVFTKKKHICPNRTNKPATNTTTISTGVSSKPTYYNKKLGIHNQNQRYSTHLNYCRVQ